MTDQPTPSPSHLELIGLHLRGALEAIDNGDPVSAENDVQTALDVLTIAIDEERMGQPTFDLAKEQESAFERGRQFERHLNAERVVGAIMAENMPKATTKRKLEPATSEGLTCIHGKFHREPCDECEKLAREAFSMPVLEDPPEGHRTVVSYGKDGVKVSTEPTAKEKSFAEEMGECVVCAEPAKFIEPRCRAHQSGQTEQRMAEGKNELRDVAEAALNLWPLICEHLSGKKVDALGDALSRVHPPVAEKSGAS